MTANQLLDGIVAQRLSKEKLSDNFSDLHAPLSNHEARVEADRCYFCYDAPCIEACPTTIDIPLFIRQISTGNLEGSAKTIFNQNILGGMCARVCPTETLCEQACVREAAEGKPVQIGLLQRHATDHSMELRAHPYQRAKSTGKHVAVVGAGPAGLACAHRLALYGHQVTIYEARAKPGGLNEYGIAAYKTVDDFARKEVEFILQIGGITIREGSKIDQKKLQTISDQHDAVFLGFGLSGVNALGAADDNLSGVENAVDFIAGLRQAKDRQTVAVGRRVVVIGGGMTAIDCAIQAKLLGAEEVTICYRRGADQMNASRYEQELAAVKGVSIRHWLQPKSLIADGSKVSGIELEYTEQTAQVLCGTGRTITLEADQIFRAIGQTLGEDALGISLERNGSRIKTLANGRTSVAGIWAGGDCTDLGDDLTVSAVAQGRNAAEDIHAHISAQKAGD